MLQLILSNIASGKTSRVELKEAIFTSVFKDNFTFLEQLAILREIAKAATEAEKTIIDRTLDGKPITLVDRATEEALAKLQLLPTAARTENGGGQIEHAGRKFNISVKEIYDFSDASKYKGMYAADWRGQALIKEECKKRSALATKNMKLAVTNYLNDPNVRHNPELYEPAEITVSVSVL